MTHLNRVIAVCCGMASFPLFAQLLGSGHCAAWRTNYTNGAQNDTVYYYPPGQLGTLTATPQGGTGPWNFVWQVYNQGTNSWNPLTTVNGQPSSTQSGLANGGYRVSITSSTNVLVGCYRAWIGTYTAGNIQASHTATCQTVNLSATVTPGTLTGYFNPPPTPMLINNQTQITVCFTANHTYVSDLGFYLVGPASCGSPTVVLAPNPGSIGMGAVCNSGDNLNNLCFSSTSAANFNVCTSPTPLTGTFGSYGVGQTPINWAPLFGCDATAPGWRVQIYDCIGLDSGALTGATITFNGQNACGSPQTVTYTTPSGFSSPIFDNSCSPNTAAIYTVPQTPAQPLSFTCSNLWTANPVVSIPNASSANTSLPAPPVPTAFTYGVVCSAGGTPVGGYMNCPDGNSSPTTYYTPVPPTLPVLTGPPVICTGETTQFTSNMPGGVWSGPGINPGSGVFSNVPGTYTLTYNPNQPCTAPNTIQIQVQQFAQVNETIDLPPICSTAPPMFVGDYANLQGPGISQVPGGYSFDPGAVGLGSYTFTSSVDGACQTLNYTIHIDVIPPPVPVITPVSPVCVDGAPLTLLASIPGGVWSGNGITGSASGQFDPGVAGPGSWLVTYTTTGDCVANSSQTVQVESLPVLTMTDPGLICINGSPVQLSAQPTGGTWSGTGITPQGSLNPQLVGGLQASLAYSVTGVCSVTEQFTVDLTPAPQPDAGPDQQICQGQSAVLSVSGNYTSVSWQPGGPGASITATTQGNYTVTVTSPEGCTGTDQAFLTVTPMPVINLGPDASICEGDVFVISAPYPGNWSTGAFGPSISVTQTGTYTYTYPNSGCPVGDAINVTVFQYPIISLGDDQTICPGQSTSFDVGYDVLWSTGAVAPSLTVTNSGTYSAQAMNGPCTAYDEVTVELLPLPIADLGPDIFRCLGKEIQLSAFNPYNSTYLWSTGATTPSISFPGIQEGSFVYSVLVTNVCGTATDGIAVTIEDCEPTFYIPNAFTPDNDGINDAWRPVVRNLTKYELIVFDRWGEVVFYSTDPEQYWTGSFQGGDYYVPPGVYPFRLNYATDRHDAGYKVGHVTVVR